MKRRNFLASTAAASLGTQILGGIPLKAFSPLELMQPEAQDDDRILIVVQLFGGNDGLNTIIPVEDPEYYRIRPEIAVQKADAVSVLSRVHFHPALAPEGSYNLKSMFEDGRLAIIQGVGYENPSLSHFRSTDIWLSGFNTSDPNKRLVDGWLGRYWAETLPGFPEQLPSDPTAVQIGGTLSMLLQSPRGDVGIALTDPQKFFELGQGLSPDLEPMSDATRYGREYNFIRLIAEQSDRYSTVVKQAFDKGKNAISYSDNGFVQQMKLVARLISGGLKSKVFLVYMGGFDTHVQQQNEDLTGLHPYLLETLSKGIGQFMNDAIAQGFADRVVGMTVSEFGRRPYENGSRGTDHGTASVQFVFGNAVRAGVYGNSPDLSNLDANGDVRWQYDYRRIYADVLETWFGGTPSVTASVFDEGILPLGVLQKPTTVHDAYDGKVEVQVRLYPNPTSGSVVVEWQQSSPASVSIDLYTSTGRKVEEAYRGVVQPGPVSIPILPKVSGALICNVVVNGVAHHLPLTVIR